MQEFSKEDVEFIYNVLRQATAKWPGRKEALALARKKVLEKRTKSGKAVYKYFWKCANPSCTTVWFRNEGDMEVDHIREIGGVGGYKGDMHDFVFRILPRPVSEHLQVLCVYCHMRKTKNYMNATKQWVRKK